MAVKASKSVKASKPVKSVKPVLVPVQAGATLAVIRAGLEALSTPKVPATPAPIAPNPEASKLITLARVAADKAASGELVRTEDKYIAVVEAGLEALDAFKSVTPGATVTQDVLKTVKQLSDVTERLNKIVKAYDALLVAHHQSGSAFEPGEVVVTSHIKNNGSRPSWKDEAIAGGAEVAALKGIQFVSEDFVAAVQAKYPATTSLIVEAVYAD